MIARVARILFVAWFVLLGGLLALVRETGWTPGCWVALYVLVLGHPTLLAVEMIVARSVAVRNAAPRARWRDLARAVLREWVESTAIFGACPGAPTRSRITCPRRRAACAASSSSMATSAIAGCGIRG
jgi:hypothetical protein